MQGHASRVETHLPDPFPRKRSVVAGAAPIVRLLTYDTGPEPGGAAFETWRQSGWPGFGGAFDVGGDIDRFRYRAALAATPRLAVSRIEISGLTWRRPAGLARRDGRDQILVQSTLSGGIVAGEAAGMSFAAKRGSVSLVDLSTEIAQQSADTRAVHLLLSRDLFTADEAERVTGPGWAPTGGPLLAGYMASLLERLPGASAGEAERVERSAAAVLLACRTRDADDVEAVRPELVDTALTHARAHVRANIGRPGLQPGEIAAAVGISRATLYRLFAAEGGVGRFVQQERLQAAAEALLDPLDARTVTQIAHACGFVDSAHFSRSFRARYRFTPTDLRPLI